MSGGNDAPIHRAAHVDDDPTLFAISVVTFIIIQLPPGDFFTTYISNLAAMGETVDQTVVEKIKSDYGFDQPIYVQYAKWITKIVTQGDFGRSFQRGRPVADLIGERLWLTVVLSLFALLITWIIAFPIGIYSAVRQYSIGDYIFTFLGFIGLAVPSFLLALVLMYVAFKYFGQSVGGLFSPAVQRCALESGQGEGPAFSICGSPPSSSPWKAPPA